MNMQQVDSGYGCGYGSGYGAGDGWGDGWGSGCKLSGDNKNLTKVVNMSEENKKDTFENLKYVLVRTCSAGVFCGYLESRKDREVVLREARRIWYWEGAASLSELAMKGVSKPNECKFPCAVDRVELLETIEIIDISEEAKKSIENVPVWTAH